jgi:hypothetical protein
VLDNDGYWVCLSQTGLSDSETSIYHCLLPDGGVLNWPYSTRLARTIVGNGFVNGNCITLSSSTDHGAKLLDYGASNGEFDEEFDIEHFL